MAQDQGIRVDFSQKKILDFEKDMKRFVAEFGEKKAEQRLRNAVTRYPLKEARSILANEANDGSGALEDKGLLVTREKQSQYTGSLLMGGGRAKKHTHGFLAHWVELGTSGVVRDGGSRYKSGDKYRAPTRGIHFLERSAEGTSNQLFDSLQKSFDKAFKKLGR